MERSYSCTGAGADGDHCCYQAGVTCPHLVENAAGRRYACGLLLRHQGDWQAMAADPDYQPIGLHWQAIGQPFNYCETFDPAFCCRPEHRHGRANPNRPIPEGVTCCGNVGS